MIETYLEVITAILLGAALYVIVGAVSAGIAVRLGNDLYSDTTVVAAALWPFFLTGAILWLFAKPLEPVVIGAYRVAAGQTFFPPNED